MHELQPIQLCKLRSACAQSAPLFTFPSPPSAGCTLKKTATAVVVGIYAEGVPHGGPLFLRLLLP